MEKLCFGFCKSGVVFIGSFHVLPPFVNSRLVFLKVHLLQSAEDMVEGSNFSCLFIHPLLDNLLQRLNMVSCVHSGSDNPRIHTIDLFEQIGLEIGVGFLELDCSHQDGLWCFIGPASFISFIGLDNGRIDVLKAIGETLLDGKDI